MLLSIFAVLIVFIAMPASLAVVESWNNAISNEYEVYAEFNNDTSTVTGYLGDVPASSYNKIIYAHYNATDARETIVCDIYDKSLFSDSYYRTILSAADTSDSANYRDRMYLGLNITTSDVLNNAATKIKVHFDAGKPVIIQIIYQKDSSLSQSPTITDQVELNSTNNYTYTFDVDIIKYIQAENEVGTDGHFTLFVNSYNESTELSPGDTVIFTWQFLKKRGSVATIYTVDNLMLGWGFLLFLIGFASTPFFNPLSRDVFPFITKMKRSRAAKRAASKRKKGKKRGSKRGQKKKRRRR